MRGLPALSRRRLLAIVLGGALLISMSTLAAFPDRDAVTRAAESARWPRIPISLASGVRPLPLPRSFFGISTEYWTLPIYERRATAVEHLISLLKVPGNGPMLLRIGGDSADRTLWMPEFQFEPAWVFSLTPTIVRSTAEMVDDLGMRLILDLNLITGTPRLAAAWARAAEDALPRGSITGFEVGNEPDLYNHRYWLQTTALGHFLPTELSAAGYLQDFHAYERALAISVPGVPLLGPAIANARVDVSWIARLLRAAHRGLGAVSAHRYPFSACAAIGSRGYPTIGRVLSERASAGMAGGLRPAVRLAHAAGLPFRLTEFNSVTCGGLDGVSNTFATALWAPDALFSFWRAGVDGANLHLRANTINAPFGFTSTGVDVRPLMYGLITFVRSLGPNAELVGLHVGDRHRVDLKAWAVQVAGHQLHVLLIDKSPRSALAMLRLPKGSGPASVRRLLAPGPAARTGVSYAGWHLTAGGVWAGHSAVEEVTRGTGGYRVSVPRYSAALVTVRLPSASRPGSAPGRRSSARRRAPSRP